MSDTPVDTSKRTWLIASGCAGAVGAGFTAVPFVSSFQPSERAKAAGAAVEVGGVGRRSGVDGVLDEFLDDRRGTLDNLACRNLVGEIVGEPGDPSHVRSSPGGGRTTAWRG